MRLNINLATRPYRDVRQFLQTWGSGTILLALLTLGLCWYTFHAWRQTRSAREQVSQIQSEIDKLDRQRADGVAMLNQPQNREIADQAAFLNSLIARRSFSWTQLFMELERIMPPRLHVTSIAPSLNHRNQIEIHMLVGGDAREQAVELVRRLENSPSFRQPELRSESLTAAPNSSGDRVEFDISMVYVPRATAEQAATDKGLQQPAADGNQALKQSTGEKKGRAAQARPAGSANANAAAGGKGVAR